jgi:hypothetical protein
MHSVTPAHSTFVAERDISAKRGKRYHREFMFYETIMTSNGLLHNTKPSAVMSKLVISTNA